MRKYLQQIFVISALLLAMYSIAFAGTRTVPSTDRLPLGDWSYDAMISLASDGLVPGMAARVFEGDRLFNRIEMADAIASVISSNETEQLSAGQISLLDKLVLEFKPELMEVSPETVESWVSDIESKKNTVVTGYAQVKAIRDIDNEDHVFVPYRLSAYTDLNSHTFAIGTLADRETKFMHALRDSDTPDKIFAKGFDSNFVWSIGSEYLNWGPSYTGSMILSDNSDPFLQLNGSKEIDFGKIFGRIKITQFMSEFQDKGKTFYLFGRRYQKPLTNKLHLGISETAKTDSLPNPLIAVMPFYLYQNLFDSNYNILSALDLTYIADNGYQLYGEFMVDDMSASKIFVLGHGDWKRKVGYTLGAYIPEVIKGDKLSTLRAEYLSVDPGTYGPISGSNDSLEYTHESEIIGHPIGRNTNAIYIRGEQYFTDKLSLIAEYLNQVQKKDVLPETGSRRVISAQLSYDINPDTSLSLRIAPTKIRIPDSASESETVYELRATKSF